MAKKSRKLDQDQAFEKLVKNVIWMTAERNEKYIGDHFLATRSIDQIFGLDEAGVFDYLLNFMDEYDITAILNEVKPEKKAIKRQSLNYFQFILLYIMKTVIGIDGMNSCEELLFTNYFAMRMAHFNARQIEKGFSRRGVHKGKRGVGEIRGVINNDTLANNIEKVDIKDLTFAYNKIIKILSQKGFFPKKLHLILDTTDMETTPKFPDCGRVSKDRPVRRKGKHHLKQQVDVYGFKLWVIYVASVEIPVAIYVDQIQVHDTQHAKTVIDCALRNLSGHDFSSIVLDRAFIDGKLLSYIDQQTPIKRFVIPAKANLDVKQEVLDLTRGRETHQRIVKRNRGKGINKSIEEKIIELQVVNNVSAHWFNPEGSQASVDKHGEDPILHAIVIAKDETYLGPIHDDKKPVFLTNLPVVDPFVIYDLYDDRSLIENELNRQLKQVWYIEHPPKRTAKAIKVHAFFSVICFAVTSCFRAHQQKEWEKTYNGKETGTERYRRALKAMNRDNVVIFVDQYYGIFKSFEPFLLADIAVTEAHDAGITKHSVVKKYSLTES